MGEDQRQRRRRWQCVLWEDPGKATLLSPQSGVGKLNSIGFGMSLVVVHLEVALQPAPRIVCWLKQVNKVTSVVWPYIKDKSVFL